ncbi:MAG: CHAP domain-containing protein [Acidimicrobiales bacterium]
MPNVVWTLGTFAMRSVFALVLLGAGLFFSVRPATASSSVLCEGYGGCSTGSYTSHDYAAHSSTSYWNMTAGDECTNYVAYVESAVYKVATPDYFLGNADEWPANVSAHGVTVNHVPSVGAVAEWGAYAPGLGAEGHVAIVEAVGPSDSWIDISQQHIDSDTDGYNWTRIGSGTTEWQSWPDNFIHFPIRLAVPLLHTAVGLIPNDGDSGYVLDGYGGLHAFGNAPAVTDEARWPGWDIARAVLVIGPGAGYTIDGYGGTHPFGKAPAITRYTYFRGRDVILGAALCSEEIDGKESGYELDEYGGVHAFGNAPPVSNEAYWKGFGIARAIAVNSKCDGGYTLDGFGGVHPFGTGEEPVVDEAYWKGFDIARGIVLYDNSAGYVLNGYGGLHRFSAKGTALPPAIVGGGYTRGADDFRGLAFNPAAATGAEVLGMDTAGRTLVFPFTLPSQQ